MTSDPSGTPPVLLHHLKHNKVLHEQVILMSITTELVPADRSGGALQVKELGIGFHTVEARYGFMESPDVPTLMGRLAEFGIAPKLTETSFYLGRETLIPVRRRGQSFADWLRRRMPMWRKRIFVVMANNARPATAYFNLPPNRVVEMGAQIQL